MELCSEHYSGGNLYENGTFDFYSEKYKGKTFNLRFLSNYYLSSTHQFKMIFM